jgi:hypothetical protein
MPPPLFLCLLFLFLVIPGTFLSSQENTPWLTDVDQAFSLARKTGKPIFAVVLCFH